MTTDIATLVDLAGLPKFMNATQKLIHVGATLTAFETVIAEADEATEAQAARDALMAIAQILNVAGSADLAPGAVAQREGLVARMQARQAAATTATAVVGVAPTADVAAVAAGVDVGGLGTGCFSVGHEDRGPLRSNLPSLAACEAVLTEIATVDPGGFEEGKYWIDDGAETSTTDWSSLVALDPIEKS